MKDTNCKNCIFSSPAAQDHEPKCEFGIVDKIKNIKEKDISIEHGYYKINNYLCRYGFSKSAYDSNQEHIKGMDLKNKLLERLKLRYYLVVDARGVSFDNSLINKINTEDGCPGYLSIIVDNDEDAKKYIDLIESDANRKYGYKIHCIFEKGEIGQVLNMILDTNMRRNNTQYFWIWKIDNIPDLNKSISSIKEILHIYQPDCDFITHNSMTIKDIYGLFLPFEYYVFIKDGYASLEKAVNKYENPRVVYYE